MSSPGPALSPVAVIPEVMSLHESINALRTSSGFPISAGFACMRSATTPATIGAQLEVPLATTQPSFPFVLSLPSTEKILSITEPGCVGSTIYTPSGSMPQSPQTSGILLPGLCGFLPLTAKLDAMTESLGKIHAPPTAITDGSLAGQSTTPSGFLLPHANITTIPRLIA